MPQRVRDYCDYRFRKNYRHSWKLARMGSFLVDLALVALAVLLILGFLSWIEQSIEDAERLGRASGEAERLAAEQKAAKASALFAAAMNGKGVVEANSRTGYFFQVSKQEGL